MRPSALVLLGTSVAVNSPIFRGFGQFGLYILALGEQSLCTSFHQRRRVAEELGQRGQRTRRDNVGRITEAFDKVLDSLRHAQGPASSAPRAGRAERPPSCRCSRPGCNRAPGRLREGARQHQPGKSAAGAEIDPRLAPSGQAQGVGASRRRAGSTSGRAWTDATRLVVLLPFQEEIHERRRAGPMFHVKRRPARARAPGRPRARSVVRRAASASDYRVRPSPCRRRSCGECAPPGASSAAGVIPSIRPAWPMVGGESIRSFWRTSFDRPVIPT